MCGQTQPLPDFTEDASLFEDWRKHAEAVDHLKVKVGRWNVPGIPPPVILVDFKSYFSERDAFFLFYVGKFPS